MIITFENGKKVITHDTGIITEYSIAELEEQKAIMEQQKQSIEQDLGDIETDIQMAKESING